MEEYEMYVAIERWVTRPGGEYLQQAGQKICFGKVK